MKDGLHIGHVGSLTWRVGAHHAIHLGADQPGPGAVVFSTPNMIMLMERAAKAGLRPFLDDAEESVGTRVDIVHLAPTPIGAVVTAEATVTRIDGRNVEFDVIARDGLDVIGRGRHTRAVVQMNRMRQKLAEKIEKLAAGELLPMNTAPDAGPLPSFTTLTVDIAGPLATVTLDRPKQLNACDTTMTDDWERLAAWLAGHEEVRVVIVTGAGRAFCAGNDVKEMKTFTPEQAEAFVHRQARLWLSLENLPQVFIAAVNGPALGGGCVMAYSMDFRLAGYNASFAMPEILNGWPPAFGIAQLTAIVGKARAIDLCLTGRTINAREAEQIGLVNRLVPGRTVVAEARKLADRLLATSPAALRETKRVIHADEGLQPKVAHMNDAAAYLRCLQTPEAQQRLASFGMR